MRTCPRCRLNSLPNTSEWGEICRYCRQEEERRLREQLKRIAKMLPWKIRGV